MTVVATVLAVWLAVDVAFVAAWSWAHVRYGSPFVPVACPQAGATPVEHGATSTPGPVLPVAPRPSC